VPTANNTNAAAIGIERKRPGRPRIDATISSSPATRVEGRAAEKGLAALATSGNGSSNE
jgi:hypothetical protein